MNRVAIRESDIPLSAFYNSHVNTLKQNEKSYHMKNKPLTLNIWRNFRGKEGENLARIIKQDGKDEIEEH